MAGQPITAAPTVELTFGLGAAVGAGVSVADSDGLDPDRRWRANQGFGAEGPPCEKGNYQGDICDWTAPDESVYAPLVTNEEGYPFVIGAGVRCSTMAAPLEIGPWHEAADRLLQFTQWSQIANELWTGAKNTAGAHPAKHLAQAAGSTTLGTAKSPTESISLLEGVGFPTMVGGPRLIHVAPRAMAYLKAENLLQPQGNRWYTALGSLVVSDDGYPGTSPAGAAAAAGTTWLYGTGPITVRVDAQPYHPEPDMVDATRTTTNDVFVRAEKLAAVTWLCGHFAVNMNLSSAAV